MLPVVQQKVLCRLATEEDDVAVQALNKCVGLPPKEYHVRVLRKVFTLYIPDFLNIVCLYIFMSTYCVCKICLSYISDGGTAAGKHWKELQFSGQHK